VTEHPNDPKRDQPVQNHDSPITRDPAQQLDQLPTQRGSASPIGPPWWG